MRIICLNDKSENGNFGDCTIIQSEGKNLVIDTTSGRDKNRLIAKKIKNYGVTTFDLLISHDHYDHLGQAIYFMDTFKITHLYIPYFPMLDKYKNTGSYMKENWNRLNEVIKAAHKRSIPVSYTIRGLEFTVGKAQIKCIWANQNVPVVKNGYHAYLNNTSSVFKIVDQGITYLTCGDIFQAEEKRILQAGVDVNADIMKLSHHGGISSNGIEFIKAVSPYYAWFNFDEGGDWAWRRDNWVKRSITNCESVGASVLSAHYNGDIIFDCNAGQIKVNIQHHASIQNGSEYNVGSIKPHVFRTAEQLAVEVMLGKHDKGDNRKKALGDSYDDVQQIVNGFIKDHNAYVRALADYVLNGYAGSGDKRKAFINDIKLYNEVQSKINWIISVATEIVEHSDNKYGKGDERKKKLGADYTVVQNQINRMLK